MNESINSNRTLFFILFFSFAQKKDRKDRSGKKRGGRALRKTNPKLKNDSSISGDGRENGPGKT